MRFDLSSLGVLSLAVASSLTVLWWMDMGGVRGVAHAAGTAGVARVARAADGHYWADALVEGRPVRLMVDTGASRVILTRADAARLGVEPAADAFSTTLATAAGPVGAAPVRLRSVAVAGVALDGVDALVVDRGLPHSLLGMSYLGRLSAFTATPTRLTLEG
ncbi:MAG: TIGR02281 family clan AA aspartic protease [Brevundimonas sp.]|uniref:TIGR02281 family clan AA aspartic protease n=1 Tax=Brevundimonas sp. TaxID=1871086 RepID=UPI001840B047|nr:TIGR02281 family clan AA aspartic protease [Brevundimonas sp.]MBA4805626.1 TIGR02281 family clan AA aspartic protease [Brevundimonas sp.]